MKYERGILFKPEMMVALLSGKKTQTRRVINLRHETVILGDIERISYGEIFPSSWSCFNKFGHGVTIKCPYGEKGDILWTRETIGYPLDGGAVIYRADGGFASLPDFPKKVLKGGKWTPAIHQKKEHSRANLLITNIRVERLQDITEEDAKAEGFEGVTEFANYIDEINGLEAWDSNAWVWVLDFKPIERILS